MLDIISVLKEIGFDATTYIEGRSSIANIFRPNERCGIYVLHFANGEHYVGQAINVIRRYTEHRQNHTDIQQISFRQILPAELDEVEKHAIHTLEDRGFKLRNIDLVAFSYGITDFDLIMSHEEQERWLDDLTYQDLAGERLVDPELRRRYSTKFAKFEKLPLAQEAIAFVREYIHACIPAVRRGEISFWNCSCLPIGYSNQIYIRINVGWQTTLDFCVVNKQAIVRWYQTRSMTETLFGESLPRFEEIDYFVDLDPEISPDGRVWIANSNLVKGGANQVFIEVENLELAYWLLRDPAMIAATRIFNLGLMQKGPCPWGKNHCLDLADRLINL